MMTRRMKRLLALAILCVTSTANAETRVAQAEGAALRVAIVPGIAVNLDTARVDALSQDLAQAL